MINDGHVRFFRKSISSLVDAAQGFSCERTVAKIHRVLQRVEFAAFPLHEPVLDLDVLALLEPIGQIGDELDLVVE